MPPRTGFHDRRESSGTGFDGLRQDSVKPSNVSMRSPEAKSGVPPMVRGFPWRDACQGLGSRLRGRQSPR